MTDVTTEAAIWAIMQAIYGLHNKLVDQGAIERGELSDFLKQTASADLTKIPVNAEVAAYFLNNMARALENPAPGPGPILSVIDGGKKD